MLNFTDLTLADINTVRPFLALQNTRICDYTIGGIFMWRDFFKTQFTVFQDTLIFKVQYLNEVTAFPIPLGKNKESAIDQIELFCRDSGIPLIFCTVAASSLPWLKKKYPDALAQPNRDWFDYLYLAKDLAQFAGRKYSGQRNHVNKFRRLYPNCDFFEIDANNIDRVRSFYSRYAQSRRKENRIAREECDKTAEVLANYAKYGMFGGGLSVDGKIVAFSLGERIGDTLFVHIEKSDTNFEGSYQVMVQEFLKHFAGDAEYVNREEDVGDKGLRKSKLSYHPCELLEKNTVLI